VADPTFTARAAVHDDSGRIVLSFPYDTKVLGLAEARALAAQLTEAIREAEAAQVPAGTIIDGVEPCDGQALSRRCNDTRRLVIGFGVRVAGALDVECMRCGRRAVMRVEVAQELLTRAGEEG
jgi:hypothetical protein